MSLQQRAEKLQAQFRTESLKVQELSEKVQTFQQQLARIQTQITESNMVKKELDVVDGDNAVFKLMGPALVKQEIFDAQSTVDARLKYLDGEKTRIEEQIAKVQKETITARDAIEAILKQFQLLQQESQQQQQAAMKAAQGAAKK